MFKYDDLYNLVFDTEIDADELIIISGYVGPAIAEDLKTLPYKTKLFVGMYGNNINAKLHDSLIKLNDFDKICINYTRILIHSKCYIWKKEGLIIKTLIGSANFSMSGLKSSLKEVLGYVREEAYEELSMYLKLINDNSYSVVDYTGELSQISYIDENTKIISDNEVEISFLASKKGNSENVLGIITNPGDVSVASGLNWGFSNGLSLPNDAYIKIPSQLIQQNPLLFPPKNPNMNEYIDVLWDDDVKMQMLFEGTQTINGVDYPKQISTYKSKKELGIYLRKRIGNKIGKNLIVPIEDKNEFKEDIEKYKSKLITRDMLDKYGRHSVNIKLIGEGTYLLDFSVKEREDEF